MGITPTRYMWCGLAVAGGAALLVASPAIVQRQQAAQAEEIRARCVRELSAKRAWRAEITETETGSDGTASVVRQELVVRKPGEYRLVLHERDTKGREVVSATIRTKGAFYTRRINADGSTELHVLRGARPSLGIELDNLLGQTVQAIADAQPLKIVGRESRNGAPADKLQLSPGRFIWVDQSTGLPVEEQVVSDGVVAHSVSITHFDDQSPVADGDFDPESFGSADLTTVEDLGFRALEDDNDGARVVGFVALDVPAPAGFSPAERGYVDPRIPNGDAPAEGAFVSAFSEGGNGVIVTQVSRPGAGDSFEPAAGDSGDFRAVEVGGNPAAFFPSTTHPRLVFVRRDVLVTIEGDLTESAMRELAERIR